MDYTRPLFNTLLNTLAKPTPVMHVLIGPRQVGKTTVARQVEAVITIPVVYGTADSPVPLDTAWIETQWRRAAARVTAPGEPVLLILDELQKVRGWSETLKLLWDSRAGGPDIRVLVLGSSALLVQEGLSESLAGRFFLHRCSHWPYAECRDAFGWSLPQWLYFGGYPGAAAFIDNETDWKSYITDSLIETVLARDVLHMHKVTKPVLLRHLFALAATLPAQCVSYTKMLGQLHDAGNTTTLAQYLKLLESAFLASGLELFSLGVRRKRGSSPKLLLWNNGLISALSTRRFSEALADTIASIVDAVRNALERCPPELSADLVDRGFVLAGGGALIRGIDRLLSERTGLPVTIATDPLCAVANGTGAVLEDLNWLLGRLTGERVG